MDDAGDIIRFGEGERLFVIRRARRLLRQGRATADDLVRAEDRPDPEITVIIPARNEELTVGLVVRECLNYVAHAIVVEGGSTDRTAEIATAAGAVVVRDQGLGKGAALRLGVDHVTTSIVVFVDADGSHDPIDIPMLAAPIKAGLAEHVTGSRLLGGSDELHGGFDEFLRLAGSAFITYMFNWRFGTRLSDSQNGFRAIRTDVFRQLKLRSRHTTIEMEMISTTLAAGLRIAEVSTHERRRAAGYSKISLAKPSIWLAYCWHLVAGLCRFKKTPGSARSMSDAYEAVIGVWDGHDAGAALIVDGRVVLALNEERLTGRKLEVGLPVRALAAMRAAAGNRRIAWAPCTSDFAKSLTRAFPSMKESYYKLRRRLVPPGPFHGLKQRAKYRLTQWSTNGLLRAWTRRSFASALAVPLADICLVDHHEAHAASAAMWPAWDRDALMVTLDGIGDGESGSVWEWSETDTTLRKIISIPGSASLGLFFEHVTNELQMRPLEDEGKVMALASFAAETPAATNPFLAWFSLVPDAKGLPVLRCSIPPTRMAREVASVIWCTPREQVCKMAQQTLQVLVPQFFAMLAAATGRGAFGYAGGVASNIKVNHLIRATPGVERLEVCPAMGDGGLALGSALAVWCKVTGRRPLPFTDFRLGTDHGDLGRDAETIARQHAADFSRPADIAAAAAERVAAGEIVMWAQGRMELGARALGARSIVARADSVTARDDLNLRLKRRVWFQPFCPSMLLVEAPVLLADYRGPRDTNLHMTTGFATTPTGRAALAGAIGPDGSCRPQMVVENPADPWYRLLAKVKELTGTGAIINTSLNMHGKPMSDAADGVVEAWLESGVQHLALGSALLSKKSASARP